MTEKLTRVVIVGRDAALWLSAATIRSALGPAGVEVCAIELPSSLSLASAYGSLPAIEALHSRLGLGEADVLRATGGSFSLGWNVVPADRAPFFLAHGAYGAPIDGRDFFSCWMKGRRHGLNIALEDFSPTAMAARQGRLLLPDEETEQFGRTDYSYRLSAARYVSLLKSRAQELGVTILNAVEISVEVDLDSGTIQSITPDGGKPISGDLFIDASGSEAALIGSALNIGSEEWQEFFPLDRCLKARGKRFSSVPIYSELKLSPAGWTALHGTQDTTYVVHAFSSAEVPLDQSLANAEAASGLRLEGAGIERIEPRLRNSPWAANCVAIGEAACALDPVFDLDLHVIQLGLVHLVSLFPASAAGFDAERAEYNRVTCSLFERLRDFQAALYVPGGSATPRTLQQKLDAFRARGTVAPMEDETFSSDQWRALLSGLDVMPETWPPAIDTLPSERLKDGFRQILGFVRKKVLEQPTHDQYLADIGARETA